MKSGFVALIGRPNTGKSTLLNYILGEKVSIVTNVPQTTRFQCRGVYNDARGQIVFVDTPGMHIPEDGLGRYLNNAVIQAKDTTDVILYIADTTRKPGAEEENIVYQLKKGKAPVIMALNKIDKGKGYTEDYLEFWQKIMPEKNPLIISIPISAKTGENIDRLLQEIFAQLREGEAYYPPEILTDFPRRLAISDIIREKFLKRLHEELPHSLAVLVDEITERSKGLTYIKATILVEKQTHKQMVIGKGGALVKVAGQEARKELEVLLEKKIYLELTAKVEPKWQENTQILKQLGYFL
ncbi:MAG: GTPase Era [Candidatus Omnitrophica bacterium]|nr:GTPase Era [Candidatus Omnitrophota bacterium]